MQLDQMSARIRRRTAWEAVDLGFAMARQWFLPLWLLWWLTALPTALAAAVLLRDSPQWVASAVWWFKPLFEPLLLFWLSRRFFGEALSWRETAGAWRRALRPRLLANLTLRRLSPSRSFYMPVSHLEGLKGPERTRRLQVLRGNHSAGSWLTIVGAHFEFALQLSLIVLGLYLVPSQLLADGIRSLLASDGMLWAAAAVSLLGMSLIAPFYVAGGFALYITRRAELEAWDLELAFRRMAPRFRRAPLGAAAALALAVALALALPAPRALAQESAESGAAPAAEAPPPGVDRGLPARARAAITRVMEDKAFGETKSVRYWKYVGPERPDEEKESRLLNFAWVRHLAEFLEYLVWVGAAVLLGWLLLYLLRLADWLPRRPAVRAATAPAMLFGLPVTPDSLPDDVPAAVRALLAEGRLRAALALLYRATLVQLVHAHQLRIPDSATEGECGRLVAEHRPAREAELFARLTRVWVWCAYGHIAPATGEITALAEEWHAVYGGPRDEP